MILWQKKEQYHRNDGHKGTRECDLTDSSFQITQAKKRSRSE